MRNVPEQQVRLAVYTQSLSYVTLFASIILIQPIFDQTYGEANSFTKWFTIIAVISALSSLIKVRLVISFGMRTMVLFSLVGQIVSSTCALIYFAHASCLNTILSFVVNIIWQTGRFYPWQSECFGIAT